jgi:hypothetical protein
MSTGRSGIALVVLVALGSCRDRVPVSPDPAPTTTDVQRATAANTTAASNPNCALSVIGPFYWEIGDRTGRKVSGSVGVGAPSESTAMSIASSSKWIYSAYVIQKVGVREQDVPFLNFTSGYSLFLLPLCRVTDTVESCLLAGNDRQNPNTIGKFFYDSGHMQKHAVSAMSLGPMRNASLSSAIAESIGDVGMFYSQPQLAGGVVGTASGYAAFLRRILRGELAMSSALGSHKVCTNPRTCSTAVASPIPDSESWNYSLGHWVEDDPIVGDHAFSSAGALGFYPWIDSGKRYYGVLARRADDLAAETNAGYNSAACGRLIRQAWLTAVAVTGRTPTPPR